MNCCDDTVLRLTMLANHLKSLSKQRKYHADRQRRYMQFKRENDPEFMDRIRKSKSEDFQRNKIEIVENKK